MTKTANATKLTDSDKIHLSLMRRNLNEFGGKLFAFPNTGLTVVVALAFQSANVCPTYPNKLPKFYTVSVAYCNFRGDSFRVKTGAFIALRRWESNEFVCVPSHDYKTMEDVAQEFADMVAF